MGDEFDMLIKPKKIIKMNTIIVPEYFGKNSLDYIVAKELINHVINNRKNPIITYGTLAAKISEDLNPRNLDTPLGNISDVCKENNLPLISSVVVNKATRLPGDGFFDYFFGERPMSEWENIFQKCESEVKNCNAWKDLLSAIGE